MKEHCTLSKRNGPIREANTLDSLPGTYSIETISIRESTSAPEHNDRDNTQREDTGWDVVERTDEDDELSRLDTRIEDFLSGSMCDDNDESMQAPDEYMSTDDCREREVYR
ncbi:hypothetical protein MAR_009643 [Mya arenaria]|uniref:Uncharacterized protein n=1 Tax=Mya arenaria TaxID=6604 RepID=A0ABY7E2C4_MYAAR|nr:hypothetical protein MAR_009643 [Mya arenaria]